MIFTNARMDPTCRLARAINDAATRAARVEVERAITAARGSIDRAARLLGCSIPLVYRYVDELGLARALDATRARHAPAKRARGHPPVPRACRTPISAPESPPEE